MSSNFFEEIVFKSTNVRENFHYFESMLRSTTRLTRPTQRLFTSSFNTPVRTTFTRSTPGKQLFNKNTTSFVSKPTAYSKVSLIQTPVRSIGRVANQTFSQGSNTLNYAIGGAAALGLASLAASGFANSEAYGGRLVFF